MVHKSLHNRKYTNLYAIGLSIFLFMLTLCLNLCKTIVCCSLLFTFLAFTINGITIVQGSKKAFSITLLCIGISFTLLYSKPYCIHGKPIDGIVLASYLSLWLASLVGVKAFLKLRPYYSFPVSNGISLGIYALVDGLAMSVFFTAKFPISRVLLIAYKEIQYKSIFSFFLCFTLFMIWYYKTFLERRFLMLSGFIRKAFFLKKAHKLIKGLL
ncbi:hypothetical protein DK880_00658 [Candidatus Cardinium hertigii]|uniref:Uncharacterized protein n=1 Tax=Candidatus Cardinium hertigii TaxID=247481 RepID=A0A2Z3LCS1_9BACT|nr:hypothetical protein DK880_00658 [Candidatus Cardinium hertigii]